MFLHDEVHNTMLLGLHNKAKLVLKNDTKNLVKNLRVAWRPRCFLRNCFDFDDFDDRLRFKFRFVFMHALDKKF